MNDDALKKLWQEQKLEAPVSLPEAEQMARIKQKMKKFDQTIYRRDLRELAAAGFVMIFFGVELFFVRPWLARSGCVVIILSCLFICWNLLMSKRRIPKADPDGPVLEIIRTELHKVEVQIRLLSSILWWYLLPLMVGCNMFFWGLNRQVSDRLVYILATVFMSAVLYWANQHAVRKTLRPLKEDLEAMLKPQSL